MINCLNSQSHSLSLIDRKLNAIHEFLQAAPATATGAPAAAQNEQREEDDMSRTIRRMASAQPEIRAKTNYLQSLEALGFPVSTSIDDVSLL